MVSLTLSGVYLEAEKVFKKQERHLYPKMLELITSVTRVTNETTENALTASELTFWFEDIIPLIFDQKKDIQQSAMKALEAVLPFIKLSPYQEHHMWPGLEQRITTEYLNVVNSLREKGDSLWHKMWSILVKLLNKKLLKGEVVNNFLTVCENGFKSSNLTTRAETFLCWQVLLEVYSQNQKYLSAKRIKLLLIPFKTISKTPEIAVNKFLVWWSLICRVENQIDQYYDTIVIPFLMFAFGLTEKPILSNDNDAGSRQELFPILTTLSVSALVNLLGPVKDTTKSICKIPVEPIRAPYALPSLLENVGKFLINSCGEATYLLKNIELADACAACENIWSNLMIRMGSNTDSTLTELILQNLTILSNESQNDEAAKKLVTIAATIALSSENLVPNNLTDDCSQSIQDRIEHLLTNDVLQFNEAELTKIINNLFKFSPEPSRLQLHLEQILSFLKSKKSGSGERMSAILWIKVVSYIEESLTEQVSTFKEIIYELTKWGINNSTNALLPYLLPSWKNLTRLLLNNDSDDTFWFRINEIVHAAFSQPDTRTFKFIAVLFEIITPENAFPTKFKILVEDVVKSTPSFLSKELLPVADEIFKFSEKIHGNNSSTTHHLLNELLLAIETKCEMSEGSQFGAFKKFRKNFEKFANTESAESTAQKTSKPKDDEFVFIPSNWQFRPDKLTEHQREKLKEKRVDIPALYNDMSQSQDSRSISLKPWTPKAQLQPNIFRQVIQSDEIIQAPPSDNVKTLQPDSEQATDENMQQSQTDSDTMPSTKLDERTGSLENVNESTANKIDDEERKERRKNFELKKLQLAIANPDQYLIQGRTRRTSINLQPGIRLRKRSLTTPSKPSPSKILKRIKKAAATATDSADSDTSEIIEASQITTPTRRKRQRNSTFSTPSAAETREEAQNNVTLEENESAGKDESSVVENMCVDSQASDSVVENMCVENQASDEQTVNEIDIVEQTEIMISDSEQPPVGKDDITDSTNVPNNEENMSTETLEQTSAEVVALHVTDNDSAITNDDVEMLEVITPPQEVSTSPVRTVSKEEHLSSSRIMASPSSNSNCSKTTELLNSTVNISPISKPIASDQPTESNHQQPSNTEPSNEKIDADQIKRTELDNLIKVPMDSPMLHPQKTLSSTPQSNKDSRRKFQMQGRGAQLLQMMNIRKVDETSVSRARSPVQPSVSVSSPIEPLTANKSGLLTYEDILATNKDLFRFSKVLPSPLASPSSSIMKRNMTDVAEMDDIDSPNQKRKRVSFHDPPVSATKEFIRFAEEVNPNRIRVNRNGSSPINVRNILTRKGRTDSLNEINKFTLASDEPLAKTLKFGDTIDDEDAANAPPLAVTFSNKDEALQYVCEQYTVEDVLSKYFNLGHTLNDTTSKLFANHLTDFMKTDETKRNMFLEDLAEKFPDEYLNVAVQENLASTVVKRLPPTGMLNYIADQAKTDNDLKLQMVEKFTSLATESSIQTEMKESLFKLLLEVIPQNLSDKQILDVMELFLNKRRTNSCS
ncbi:Telomere-associated protein RIF1 [Pseudolycoriella hygida]|uniref:Telomere-associated protein RIF1 n=1 Tax=Pseudolycoriella hygida TaxID=35572 RepID=A0A9Q0NEQ3_9DIPT|nr:Telomere-associated protein RIF1 [Pseudolycoriella hygida]